jgi:Secretion system C-terminal sorting domain/Beta-propeller repeat
MNYCISIRNLLLLFVLFTAGLIHAQTIPFQWVSQADALDASVQAQKMTTDSRGNIYLTGYFGNKMLAGGDTLFSTVPPYSDIFLIKYDSSGNYLWSKSYGREDTEYSYGITTDSDDNVYICGVFYSDSIVFDAITIYKGNNYSTAFWAKFSSTGQCLIAQAASCTQINPGLRVNALRAIAVDNTGNIFVTGGFEADTLCFGNTCVIWQNAVPQTFGSNILVAKFDATGNCLWIRGADAANVPGGSDAGYALTFDQNNNVFMAGKFAGNRLVFGGHTLGVFDMEEAFCARLDNATGTVVWAKAIRGFSPFGFTYDEASGIMPDNSGHVYIGGTYEGQSVNYDSVYTVTTPVNAQNPDGLKVFLFKADAATGTVVWGKAYGNNPAGGVASTDWALHPSGNRILASGNYNGPVSLGTLTLPASSFPALNGFLIELDTTGIVLRGIELGGIYSQEFSCATYDFTGAIVAGGKYSSPVSNLGTQFTLQNPVQPGMFLNMFVCRSTVPYTVGIEPQPNTLNLHIWPNPSSGQLNFSVPAGSGKLEIQVTDMAGRVVISEILPENTLYGVLNTENLTGGKYILSVKSDVFISNTTFVQAAQ